MFVRRLSPPHDRAAENLEPAIRYRATLINPSTTERTSVGTIIPDSNGNAPIPKPPVNRDWLILLESE